MSFRAGFANILGSPNVGKSTLLNALLGEKLTITNPKPQTTRHRVFGIHNEENCQIIFSDTPGMIAEAKYGMQKVMNKWAFSVFEDADLLLLMVDVADDVQLDGRLKQKLTNLSAPKFLIVNKIDSCTEKWASHKLEKWSQYFAFDQIFKISALEKIGISPLLHAIQARMPENPPYFPEDQLSDRPVRFFVSELIREKILEQYHQEIPYSCEVEVESYNETKTKAGNGLVRISAIIYVNRKSQKAIVIGSKGNAIRTLGKAARLEIEEFIGSKVFLELYVKVKEGWREDMNKLSRFGYR